MIVGAHKAGTSSLAQYLDHHTSLTTHDQLEMTFFIRDEEYEKGYDRIFDSYFNDKGNRGIVFAKNVGVMYSEVALKRLHDHNPDCKLIISLRNPVDRAYSNYWYSLSQGWENEKTFEAALSKEERRTREKEKFAHHNSYIDRGMYAKHITQILKYFPSEQLHIVLLDEIKANPEKVIESIYRFIGIPQIGAKSGSKVHNKATTPKSAKLATLMAGGSIVSKAVKLVTPKRTRDLLRRKIQSFNKTDFEPPKMKPETRELLIDKFESANKDLSKILGVSLNHWNK
ncbi:MAG: sulfotransferase [Roseivirga sp.]